jgi:hypothetical protein
MFIETPDEGYHFKTEGLKTISQHYGATYLGYFQKKFSDGRGGYQETPVDVWYQPKPDTSKGHSHYFGMYIVGSLGHAMITDAGSCFEEPLEGMLCDDNDEVIISRFRHHYVGKKGAMIDGGRAYTRSSLGTRVRAYMKDGQWSFEVPLAAKADLYEPGGVRAEMSQIEKEFLDPENRAWEYDAAGVRVFKGTRTPFTGDMV